MIFGIAKLIASVFGLDISKVQRWVVIGLGIIALIAVVSLGLWLKSCFTKPPKLDEKAIQEAQTAIAEHNDTKLKEVLANADVKEKVIADEVTNAAANTEAVKVEAKKKYDNMNTQALQDEFNRQAGIK